MGSQRSWFNYLPKQLFRGLQPLNIPLLEAHFEKQGCCQAHTKSGEPSLACRQKFSLQQQVTFVVWSVDVYRGDSSEARMHLSRSLQTGHPSFCSPRRRLLRSACNCPCQEGTALFLPCSESCGQRNALKWENVSLPDTFRSKKSKAILKPLAF